uniref:LIM and SH3 domain protein Lasp-like n=1 Tax=Saccoglossus kowalevskii TaxID=10224 RepID=A0ABM0LY99_SACKO|nr:PREDICTED: LIM and SH3 domain protein Lasp-like [Saccoglossus kowalevskii]
MNPPCARCKKTVYPMEKLNCLDKIWHKACFTCEECNLKLTMQTYKGYNKLPYCKVHYPTTKFTAVADTPENLRLKKQQKAQSSVSKRIISDHKYTIHTYINIHCIMHRAIDMHMHLFHNLIQDDRIAAILVLEKLNQPSSIRTTALPSPPRTPSPEPAPIPTRSVPPPQPRYRALYDYDATDSDEVTFIEGDTFINIEVVDAGWLSGTNERNGQEGMLPANYVEQI